MEVLIDLASLSSWRDLYLPVSQAVFIAALTGIAESFLKDNIFYYWL